MRPGMECNCPGVTSTRAGSTTDEIEEFTILESKDSEARMDSNNKVKEAHIQGKNLHAREQAKTEMDNAKVQEAHAQSELNTAITEFQYQLHKANYELHKVKYELHKAKCVIDEARAELNYANAEESEAEAAMSRGKTGMNRTNAKLNEAKPQLKDTHEELLNTTTNELIGPRAALKTTKAMLVEIEAELKALTAEPGAETGRNRNYNLYALGIALLFVLLLVAHCISHKGNINPTTTSGPGENILKQGVQGKFENMVEVVKSKLKDWKEGMGRTLKSKDGETWTDNGQTIRKFTTLNANFKVTINWE